MDLTDRQRIFLFAGLVVVLAIVGVYLTWPRDSSDDDSTPASAASSVPGTSAPRSPAPVTAPSGFDIYPLLPYSQKEFADAAELAKKFTAGYGTYRYDEDPKVYINRLQSMITPELRSELARGAASAGQIEERKKTQEVATAEAKVESLQTIEKNSLIFIVTGRQQVISSGKSNVKSERYSVTVEKVGGGWIVHTFQPADVGAKGGEEEPGD